MHYASVLLSFLAVSKAEIAENAQNLQSLGLFYNEKYETTMAKIEFSKHDFSMRQYINFEEKQE